MKAVIFSGTTEGRLLAAKLAAMGFAVTVSVATALGAEEQGTAPGITVHAGRLQAGEMEQLLQGAALCIDATHPYAAEASRNIRAAAAAVPVEYLRLLRRPSPLPSDSLICPDAASAAELLADTEGSILLATGAKELAAFAALPRERLYPRVLPTQEGIAACEAAGIPHRNILALQGPFSQEMNAALIRQYSIRWLVTKDGGTAGGFLEKAAAAQQTGARLVVLRRPPETNGRTESEILERCREVQSRCSL
ncbi:MAG: precorrin-6A reductase [Faecalibacterium sp.]